MAGDPDDVTFRAVRILHEVSSVAAVDPPAAHLFLAEHDVSAPVVAATAAAVLAALVSGDVALLHDALQPALPAPALACVRSALESGTLVVPVPGPSLLLAAAVISGLPADNLIVLGPLPGLDIPLAVLAGERRTLVALETASRLPETVAALLAAWGDRPVAIVGQFTGGPLSAWRGWLTTAAAHLAAHPPVSRDGAPATVLVIGGAKGAPGVWDEARLHAELEARLAQGQRVRQIAQELAAESGWPRRDIYRLATRPHSR